MRTLVSGVVRDSLVEAQGAVMIDLFLVVGILVAIHFVDRLGSIRMQIVGFVGCAAGLGFSCRVGRCPKCNDADHTYLRRVYYLSVHDQCWAKRTDLPDCGGGVPDIGAWYRSGVRRSVWEGGCCHHCVSLSNSASMGSDRRLS